MLVEVFLSLPKGFEKMDGDEVGFVCLGGFGGGLWL